MATQSRNNTPRSAKDDLKEMRREQILDAATKIFSRDGFRRTDVQNIADATGVGKGTVYRYFESKEKLFLCTVDKAMEELQNEILVAIGDEDDPLKKLRIAAQTFLSFFERRPELVEIFIQERSEFRSRKKLTYFIYRDKNIWRLEETLQKGIECGLFREINTKEAALVLTQLLYGTVMGHFMSGRREKLTSKAEIILDIFLNGVRR